MSDRPTERPSRAWLLVASVALLPVLAALILDAGDVVIVATVILAGLVAVASASAWALQRTRRQRHNFEERLATWSAERAVAQERLRIARDLHDISSHGLGIITVRASSSAYLTGPDADEQRQKSMLDIERVSRTTTAELRRMLVLLRSAGEESAPLRPIDTLAALPGILEEAERNGLIVQLRTEGIDPVNGEGAPDSPNEISPSAQLTICAVIREALTNVVRHAGPTTVALTLSCEDDLMSIVVDDDGPHPGWRPASGSGHGLVGLRERLRTHGGSLVADKRGRGFHLRATLTVRPSA